MASPKPEISTIVFFHLESTALPSRRTQHRITELCLIAVQRADLMTSVSQTPRVLNQLQLCVNPQCTIIAKATKASGLTNDALLNQPVFDKKTCELIEGFLNHLKRPVCLVAHNGKRFDFPLLRAEFSRCEFKADPELLCGDSLQAFKALDLREAPASSSAAQSTSATGGSKGGVFAAAGKATKGGKKVSLKRSQTAPEKPSKSPKQPKVSYSLDEVCKRLLDESTPSKKTARAKTKRMMRCAMKHGSAFLDWLDEEAVPLAKHEPTSVADP